MGERHDDRDLLVRLLDCAPAVVMLVDAELTVRWLNETGAELFGFTVEEIVGRSVLDYLDPDWDPEAFESIATAMGGSGMRQPMLFRMFRADGTKAIVEVTANSQMDDPVVGGMVCYARRWDERYMLDQALEAMAASRPLEQTLALLVAVAEAETLDADAAILHERVGGAFGQAVASSGLPPALQGPLAGGPAELHEAWRSILERGVGDVWAVDDLPPVLAEPATAAGYRTLWVWPSEVHADARGEGGADVVAVAWRREDHLDVDQTRRQAMARLARVAGLVYERVRTEEETTHAATHDALTGLANRARFYELLEEGLERAPSVGVIYLDLDGFKPINDVLGHGAGDAVLAAVAERIGEVVPMDHLAARLGGDEFAVVCHGADEPGSVALARQLIDALSRPVDVGGPSPVRVGASAGVSIGRPGVDPDELVDAADAALYEAKRSGGGEVRVGHVRSREG